MKNILLLIGLFLFFSCSNSDATEEILEEKNTELKLYKPVNFPEITFNSTKNPTTKFGIELGRKLFHEGKLSSDGATDCASCHIQANAFTHHGHTLSHGTFNRIGKRNAPPIQNMAFMRSFNWEGSITDLETQPITPITTDFEMDENFPSIISKLNTDKNYPILFKKAFGDENITSDRMLKALSQFMATMISANAKYDKMIRKEGVIFTEEEKKGNELFNQKCGSCHSIDLFTDQSFRNNGLTLNPLLNDLGRFNITSKESDKQKFRVPSLRNIELTAPYMHDGRFSTLEAVLNHYSEGMENQPNLDPIFKQDTKIGIKMNSVEKQQIITFLKTLTDEEFIKNTNFSAP